MKIAAYNIWNDSAGMPFRLGQITDEIISLNADIICLQEVGGIETHERLACVCGYEHSHFQGETGLSILSRIPFESVRDNQYSAGVKINLSEKTLAVINVHLPWDSVLKREKAIVDIVEKADEPNADYTIIMGDFNNSENSSVHRFMKNEMSLFEKEAYYFDLAEAFAEITGTKPPATLDFRKNPRWSNDRAKNTIETNQRFDRMMLNNPYPNEFPELIGCGIFGTEVSRETKLAASDHYGVYAEIKF